MGMTPDEFWDCTPKEFFLKMEGFFDHQMFLQRQEWERTRWATNLLWNIQVAPKDRLSLTEMIRFEWEKPKLEESTNKPITKEELQELIKFYDRKK